MHDCQAAIPPMDSPFLLIISYNQVLKDVHCYLHVVCFIGGSEIEEQQRPDHHSVIIIHQHILLYSSDL